MTVARMLTGHSVFQSLGVEEVNRISQFSSVKSFEKGDAIFEYDRPASHVFLLLEGEVFLHLPGAAGELNLAVSKVDKGELFGLSPLLGSPRYTLAARCTQQSSVLAIEAKALSSQLEKNHVARCQIMSEVANIYFNRYIEVVKNLQAVLNQIPLIR